MELVIETKKAIRYGQHKLNEDDVQAVVDMLRSGPITQGQTVEKFGESLASNSWREVRKCGI